MPEDQYATCPFNKNHQIVSFRMPAHILKCRKNYSGPPLETCIYNATHLVPQGTMEEHLLVCKDGHTFNGLKYIRMANKSGET